MIRTSTFERLPSTVSMTGAYSTFRIRMVCARSASGTASKSSRVTSTFTPEPAKEKRGFKTQRSRSRGGPSKSERSRASGAAGWERDGSRSEEHTSELQSQSNLVCRLLLEKKKK